MLQITKKLDEEERRRIWKEGLGEELEELKRLGGQMCLFEKLD